MKKLIAWPVCLLLGVSLIAQDGNDATPIVSALRREGSVIASTSKGLYEASMKERTWRKLETPTSMPPGGELIQQGPESPVIGYYIAWDADPPGGHFATLFVSGDAGRTWTLASQGLRLTVILIHPNGKFFAIETNPEHPQGNKLLCSENMWATWRDISWGLERDEVLKYIFLDPDNSGEITALEGWKSTTGVLHIDPGTYRGETDGYASGKEGRYGDGIPVTFSNVFDLPQLLDKRARARAAKGDWDGAVEDFTRIIALEPTSAAAFNNRGLARLCDGHVDFEPAIGWIYKTGHDVPIVTGYGHFQPDSPRAMDDFNRAIKLDPNFADTYINRGDLEKAHSQWDEAIADYTRAIEADPKNALAYKERGNAKVRKDNVDGAVADLTRAIELDPKDADAYNSRGNAKKASGKVEEAIADYTRAITLDPKDVYAYYNRGFAEAGSYDPKGAIEDYTRVMELDPKFTAARDDRARAKITTGDLDGAISDFNRAIEADSKDTVAWSNRSLAKNAAGDPAGAAADFNRANEIDPQHYIGPAGACDPLGDLLLSGGTLYGTTSSYGGSAEGGGAVYRINADGTGFKVLHGFSLLNGPSFMNSDGASPRAGLAISGKTLYGTASQGGIAGRGTVFKVNTDGRDFTVLHSFNGSAGGGPTAGLVLSENTLYGTASGDPDGVVFKIKTDGTGFKVLHAFGALSGKPGYTNNDGAYPSGELTLSGKTLYGTATGGGPGGTGTIFKVNTDGTGFHMLHGFTAVNVHKDYSATNDDGASPGSALVVSGDQLYGTASRGGDAGGGTVFKINSDGTGFATLHSFENWVTPGRLMLSGNILYGTIWGGNLAFKINIGGTDFTTLPFFTADNAAWAGPIDGLLQTGKVFYGTTMGGGKDRGGIVFKINTDTTGFSVLHSFIEKEREMGGAETD